MLIKDELRAVVDSEGVKGELVYNLISEMVPVEDEYVHVYGIAVTFQKNDGIEFDQLHNIASSRDDTYALMEKMCNGLVFPVTLRDIAEDYIVS